MLTLEQVKSLKTCDWIWVRYHKECGIDEFYAEKVPYGDGFLYHCAGCKLDLSTYGTVWEAYRNKEEVTRPENQIRKEALQEAIAEVDAIIDHAEKARTRCKLEGNEADERHWVETACHYKIVRNVISQLLDKEA